MGHNGLNSMIAFLIVAEEKSFSQGCGPAGAGAINTQP
jgi:hypothetical protein